MVLLTDRKEHVSSTEKRLMLPRNLAVGVAKDFSVRHQLLFSIDSIDEVREPFQSLPADYPDRDLLRNGRNVFRCQ